MPTLLHQHATEASRISPRMGRALWGLAIVADALGLVATWPFLIRDASTAFIIWNCIVFSMFCALILLLLKPQLAGEHARLAAKVLSSAVPAAALLGSLDNSSVSPQEAFAIVVAALVGWLNWLAFKKHATRVHV